MVGLKTIVFTLVFPGMVVGMLPFVLVTRTSPLMQVHFGSLRYSGVLLIALGALVYVRCAWDFVVVGQGTPAPWDPPRRLVRAGVYKHVRNPIFLALLLVVVGEAVYWQAAVLMVYAVFLFTAFHGRVVLFEEPLLRAEFGEVYERYCAAVPRWLPRGHREQSLDRCR